MLFNSISFLIFFPLVLVIYYLLPKVILRTWFLLVASYFFYLSLNPYCALILLGSTCVTYFGGIMLELEGNRWTFGKKGILYTIVILNVALLAFFKYSNFIADNVVSLLSICGESESFRGFDILLPVGISFYVFKAVSYISDVYFGKIPVEKNFCHFALYVAFFPQLLAGPIERAGVLLPQFKKKVLFDGCNITAGLKMMLWGYFMKIVFADRAVIYVDTIYGNLYNQNGTSILLAAVLYSFQIYCDFAGYSLLSIGVAKAMGYDVMQNFNRPYLAQSITEFWKRWHISLTKWLTDYVYIPLGGSRCSKIKSYRNIMITFLVSGLWHGAAWNFVVWGMLHGIIQVIEKHLGYAKRETTSIFLRGVRIIVTFFVVTIAWMFFRLPNFNDVIFGITKIFTSVSTSVGGRDATPALEYCALGLFLLIAKDVLDEYYPGRFLLFDNKNIVVRYVSYILVCLLILAAGVFDAGQFIYMQF